MSGTAKSQAVTVLGVLLLAGVSVPASADDDCDIGKSCPHPKYEVFYPNNSGYTCPPSVPIKKGCRDTWEPPYPAALNCEYTYGGYLCEAWPQGSTLRYAYSASGPISIPYPVPEESPIASVACWTSGAGSLTVTITSAAAPGQSSVVTQSLYCP